MKMNLGSDYVKEKGIQEKWVQQWMMCQSFLQTDYKKDSMHEGMWGFLNNGWDYQRNRCVEDPTPRGS